jgi:hypothetical protein
MASGRKPDDVRPVDALMGAYDGAGRGILGAVYEYGRFHELCDTNPATRLKGRLPSKRKQKQPSHGGCTHVIESPGFPGRFSRRGSVSPVPRKVRRGVRPSGPGCTCTDGAACSSATTELLDGACSSSSMPCSSIVPPPDRPWDHSRSRHPGGNLIEGRMVARPRSRVAYGCTSSAPTSHPQTTRRPTEARYSEGRASCSLTYGEHVSGRWTLPMVRSDGPA